MSVGLFAVSATVVVCTVGLVALDSKRRERDVTPTVAWAVAVCFIGSVGFALPAIFDGLNIFLHDSLFSHPDDLVRHPVRLQLANVLFGLAVTAWAAGVYWIATREIVSPITR